MARYPTRGRVKTRLAAAIGTAAATAAYRWLLARCRREFARTPFAVEWWFTPARAPFRRVVGAAAWTRPQPPGSLGRRMQAAFADALGRGYRRVVIIGVDAPEVEQSIVGRAFRLLARHAVVLQPAEDGGYALIGVAGKGRGPGGGGRGELPDLFRGIPWGTSRVLECTRARLRRLRLPWAELPVTYDVDTAADWDRCRRTSFCIAHKL
ncbi:glycosyltransferase [bacterium]|nr:glycosyltransferase [bacterium]